MSEDQDFSEFIHVYPKYWHQRIARHAYAFARTRASHQHLMAAVQSFADRVLAERPYGDAWIYCVAPARWLGEQMWLQEDCGNLPESAGEVIR